MIETGTANSFEEIAAQVNERRLFGKFFKPARLSSTAHYWGRAEVRTEADSITFQPNARRVMLVFGPVGTVVLALAMQHSSQLEGMERWTVPLGTGLLFTGMLLGIVWLATRHFTILLDRSGITINEAFLPWSAIRETGILRLRQGKSTRRYLVLWLTDGRYELIDLSGFFRFRLGGFAGELAGYVEYYSRFRKVPEGS